MTLTAPLIFALVALPSFLGTFDGSWCGQDSGEIMQLDGTNRIGFNEHTLCEADSVVDLTGGRSWSGALSCKNVYVEGPDSDGNFIVHETPLPDVSIRIEVLNPDQLVATPIGRPAETYDFCG